MWGIVQGVGLAEEIIKGDDQIDQLEVEIERRCIRKGAMQNIDALSVVQNGTAMKYKRQ